jgi:hypothetical protein
MAGRHDPSWSGALLLSLAALGAFGWGGWGAYTLLDLLQHGTTVEARSIRTVEGNRRGHWTTTFALEGGECVLDTVHVQPGETMRVIRDRQDPTRCVADAFFPTLYWPLACFTLGALCVAVVVRDVRRLL